MSSFFHKPLAVIRNRIAAFDERRRFELPGGYRAKDYWREHHERFGFDRQSVGGRIMSEEENLALLRTGAELVLGFCRRHGMSMPGVRVLDVGCGTGFYAGALGSAGILSYTGVDIVDTLFEGLRERFPAFIFRPIDISERLVEGEYDLILMLDVAHHITDDRRFAFAMRNLKLALAPDGIIVISANLGTHRRRSFYFTTRPLEMFTRHFPGWHVDGPVQFGDNGMFVMRRINTA